MQRPSSNYRNSVFFRARITVLLEDHTEMRVSKDLYFPVDEWNEIVLRTEYSYKDEWKYWDETFNWGSVKKIAFYSHFPTTGTGSF